MNYQYRIEASGVTRYGLGNYALSNSAMLLPPLIEQNQISEYLEQKNNLIEQTINGEKRGIEFLKEYRASMISEVVTGKLGLLDF